jgi:hypothetical protein
MSCNDVFCGLLFIQSSKTEPPYWASASCHITCACLSPIHPFSQPPPTCPFTMCIVKQTNTRCECGSSHRALMVLKNRSIPWACASQHPSPLYTQTSDTKTPFHRHLHSLHFHFPFHLATTQHHGACEEGRCDTSCHQNTN